MEIDGTLDLFRSNRLHTSLIFHGVDYDYVSCYRLFVAFYHKHSRKGVM